MELTQSVNATSDDRNPSGIPPQAFVSPEDVVSGLPVPRRDPVQGLPLPPRTSLRPTVPPRGNLRTSNPAPPQPFAVQYPCLYIGPAGQRCSLPAREDGFCVKHQLRSPTGPGANAQNVDEISESTIAKRALAVIGVLVALWPLIAELIRELRRLLR